MGKRVEYIGKKFGKLTVIEEVAPYRKNRFFLCECSCSSATIVKLSKSGLIEGRQNCGCEPSAKRLEANARIGKLNSTHGMTGTKLHKVWSRMRERCRNKNRSTYHNYGGRGIKICDRWLESFENFYEDMSEGFREDLYLDRIDNEGDYCPENCRWVTHLENCNNKSPYVTSTSNFRGVRRYTDSIRWLAEVTYNQKKYYGGVFDTELSAALKVNELIDEYNLPIHKNNLN